jgi:hypothetical protein
MWELLGGALRHVDSTEVSAQRCVVPVKRAKQAADKQLHLRQAEQKEIRANPRLICQNLLDSGASGASNQ